MEGDNCTRRNSSWAMLFIIAIAYLMSGCIYTEYQPLGISLAPKVPEAGVNIGRGTKIYLSVLDQRPEKILGYRGFVPRRTGWGIPLRHEVSGTISASEDIVALVQKSLKDGLASLGFEMLTAPEPSVPKLEVAVQRLIYEMIGIPVWGSHGYAGLNNAKFSCLLTGKLYKGDTLLYEKSYFHHSREYPVRSAGDEIFIREVQRQRWFEENFNAALSDLMGQLLADLELLAKLKS